MYVADPSAREKLFADWGVDPEENRLFEVTREQKARALSQAVRLWPEGAPGAQGTHWRDIPMLYPLLPQPEAATGAAVIVCPGGGYRFHAPWEGIPVGDWLNALGIAAFVLQYRLMPYLLEEPLLDAQRAIRLVRARATEYGVDPSRLGIMGFSAGGHLASAAATLFDAGDPASKDPLERPSSRPDAAMLIYPVTDRRMLRPLAGGVTVDPALLKRFSTNLHVTDETPSTFLWHNLTDQMVPYSHSLSFANACAQHNVPFELHIWGAGKHGAGVADADVRYTRWKELLAVWLRIRGFCG